MNLLLDTHVWIWAALEPRRLSQRVREAIENPENLLLVSPISCWEIAMLQERGRLSLPATVEAWIKDALAVPGMEIAPLTCEIAVAAVRLPAPFHGDPADRFLVATARHTGMPIITSDRRILQYPHVEARW